MFDVVVIGSGAGGSTVAQSLTKKGFRVVLLEKGFLFDPSSQPPPYSNIPGDVEVMRATCLGGSTVVSLGNVVQPSVLDDLLRWLGVSHDVVMSALKLLNPQRPTLESLSRGSKAFAEACLKRGLEPKLMLKHIDYGKCVKCGMCSLGCKFSVKWDASKLVGEARYQGLTVLEGFDAKSITCAREGFKVEGLWKGSRYNIKGRVVVMACGAVETPNLIRTLKSPPQGVGESLFVDPFVTVGGLLKSSSLNNDVSMSLYVEREGYMLSPHFSQALYKAIAERFPGAGPSDIVGIMVKVADEGAGHVDERGGVVAKLSKRDRSILERGVEEAKELLSTCGVEENTITTTRIRGAHPGGTAALGRVVDRDMQVKGCEGVFVADSSLLKPPLGMPPILTIMALALACSTKIEEYFVG